MPDDFWLSAWENNEIGFHQPDGHQNLPKFWQHLPRGQRILVPLCGKAQDLIWLAKQGHDVTGVELSEIAVKDFFDENQFSYETIARQHGMLYKAKDHLISIYCGDFFDFASDPFDALYDRAALVALPSAMRLKYVDHCKSLLANHPALLLVTLEYDESQMTGPPFSVSEEEVVEYWGNAVERVHEHDIIESLPRFKKEGLESAIEKTWQSKNVAT